MLDANQVTFVNTVVVPLGLILIMFSLGLSLTAGEFRRVFTRPHAIAAGLLGQLVLLPALGFGIVSLFALPPEMAVGLFILAVCPGGVTSNAIVFALRAHVALSVCLTAVASLVTVFTTPLLIGWALSHFFGGGEVPDFSILRTIRQLAVITILPVSAGMALRYLRRNWADRFLVWLRPTSLVVLIAVIAFSVYVSADLVASNVLLAGPAALVLNLSALAAGFALATAFRLDRQETLTVSIEVGIQNVTVATFLALTVLQDVSLAIAPTLYGVIMVTNAFILGRLIRNVRSARAQSAR